MSNTYSQLFVQIIFAVNHRQLFIKEDFREVVEKYIFRIIENKSCVPLSIYCNPDHIHILISTPPNVLVSDLVRDIKSNSSKFINQQHFFSMPFAWQRGFGAFSYSKSQIDAVTRYIRNQPLHHKKHTFKEEYLAILKQWGISYDERYVFNWHET